MRTKKKSGPHCRLLTWLLLLSTLTTRGIFNPTCMSVTAASCGKLQFPSSAVLKRPKSWTGELFLLIVSKPHGKMAVSPLIRISRPKHQQMLCFAECSDLTAVAFSFLHRSRPEIKQNRHHGYLWNRKQEEEFDLRQFLQTEYWPTKEARHVWRCQKKKTQNGKITSMLFQVLLRFPQIRATVLLSSRLS